MGRLLQLLFQYSREEILTKMAILLLLIALTAGAQGAPGGGHFAYGHQQQHCHTEYNTQIEQSCHDEYDQECHDEFDTVVDTTYVGECQDIIIQQCHEATQQVHHSSAVLGQDSQVILHHHGYTKREARPQAESRYTYVTGPSCHAKKDRKCHRKPVQNSQQVPRQVCVPVARQVCVPHEVQIPYEVCGHSHVYVEQYPNDLVYQYYF